DDTHSAEPTDMWLGVSDGSDPVWLEYGFDTVYRLHEMLIWNYNAPSALSEGFGLKDVTVEYSTDGAAWSALRDVELAQGTEAPDYAANTVVHLGGVAAKYVRLVVHSNWGTTAQYGLSEVRFFYIPTRARYPRPADGESGIDVDLILGWSAGREAVVHEVHHSHSAPLVATGVARVGSVTTNRYALRPLDFGTTYYWRVDEINQTKSPSSWAGRIWTYTTREYAMIDDFEVYTDDSGRRIYQIWRDGESNGSGSYVGYLDAPFAEQTIVHGGGQSMPFEYNNADAPFYSEAVRSLAIEQNWQGHGADTLRLFVRGQAGNDPGSLYIAIEDRLGRLAVATHPNPAALTSAVWQEWTIPYSAFGDVRLSAVQKIYLGVGDRDNPVPGGSGLIFIDDLEYGHPSGGTAPSRGTRD
ncbi:MAG: discoidin domain-containing protein, partial [Phycisphaerales bacterium]